MARPNEGPAFTRITTQDVTVDAPNGTVQSQGESPADKYRGSWNTLKIEWIPDPLWGPNSNRTGE